VLASFAVVVSACGGEAPPTPDPSSLRALRGGRVVGFRPEGRDVHVWRGLRYARPPLGELRWRAPRPAEPWSGTLEALSKPSPCVQFDPTREGELLGSEDCLALNVFAPRFEPQSVPMGAERLPVMVWIHGGGNTIGESGTYDGSALVEENRVVVVTLNYRLGVFGWLSHPALRAGAESADDASGNFGTLDAIAALEWVRDNIKSFGGDPERVTVFGESAGGINAYSLLLSPRARGLFQRAISQSGMPVAMTRAQAENYADGEDPAARGMQGSSREILVELLQRDGRAPTRDAAKTALASMSDAEIAADLRAKQPEELLAVFRAGLLGGMYFAPNVFRDGAVIPDLEPLDALRRGPANPVPFIAGTNREESKLFLAFGSDQVTRLFGLPLWIRDYERFRINAEYGAALWKADGADEPAAALAASAAAPVFTYRFDWDEEGRFLWLDLSKLLGASHAIEVLFVFGMRDLGFATRALYADPETAALLSRQMRSYWAQFAATGAPGRGQRGDLPEWGAWSAAPSAPKAMLFDSAAGGGLRMDAESLTRAEVVGRVARDSRLPDAERRCEIYRGFVQWSSALTPEQYAAIDGGACAAHPLEKRTPMG
jgi:para-nitrobenzyl esterase